MDPLPLPDDPTLATFATVLNELGHSSHILDARWRIVFITDELRLIIGDHGGSTIARLGEHWFGSNEVAVRRAFFFDDWQEGLRENFRRLGPSSSSIRPVGVTSYASSSIPSSMTSSTRSSLSSSLLLGVTPRQRPSTPGRAPGTPSCSSGSAPATGRSWEPSLS